MTTKTIPSAPFFAGIDVGAEELFLVIRHHGIATKAQKFANTPAERRRLVKTLLKHPRGSSSAWRLRAPIPSAWRWHSPMPGYG